MHALLSAFLMQPSFGVGRRGPRGSLQTTVVAFSSSWIRAWGACS